MDELNKNRDACRKGYVFSVDALLAIFVVLILIASFSFFSSRSKSEAFPLMSLQIRTNDVLVTLDKLGYLSGKSSSNISLFTNRTLGSSVGWQMDIEYYNYTEANNTFKLASALHLGDNSSNPDEIALSTRVFLVKNATNVTNYGRVMLKTWSRWR